jgi:hypothetical protein
MYVGIGFLVASLIGLGIMPLVHGRAIRLTKRRLEASLPQLMAEVQAAKDLQRAQFAMSTRSLEVKLEQSNYKAASQLAELGRQRDAFNRLKAERDALKVEIIALKAKVTAAAHATELVEQVSLVPVLPMTKRSAQARNRSEALSSYEQTTGVPDAGVSDRCLRFAGLQPSVSPAKDEDCSEPEALPTKVNASPTYPAHLSIA